MMIRPLALALLGALAAPTASAQVVFTDEAFEYDHDRPVAGDWLGNVQTGPGPAVWGALSISSDDDGAYSASITLLTLGLVNSACADVTVDRHSIEFAAASTAARFIGQVSDAGQRLTGTMTVGAGSEPGSFEFARTPLATHLPDPLAYRGELESAFGNLAMTLVFAETAGGNWVGLIDVPAQGLTGLPLIGVHREGDAIKGELGVPAAPARITVEFSDDRQRLTGRFKQGPFDLEIDFPRDAGYAPPTFDRPQHPEPPYPYIAREVTIEHPLGHVLAGTLTIPEGPGPFPAAVLITGSGPQDRDETIFNHKPFLVIADYLTRHGIAVLRYDDRGTAGSTGSFTGATTADFATDALAAMRFISTVDGIDRGRIGLIGHSEGGIIAPMVAGLTDDVAFMVLLAGTGVPGDELLRVQGELVAKAMGVDEAMIATNRAQQEKLFELIRTGGGSDELEQHVRELARNQLEALGIEGQTLDDAVEAQVTQVMSPWMQYFITYDPRPALGRVRCPVLALNGMLDLQVYHDQNLPEIEEAITQGGGDVTIRRYEGLNHLFQPATTGAVSEYGTIQTTFDEAVLRDIVEWIRAR